MENKFVVFGQALEEIRCGDYLEINFRTGHTRKARPGYKMQETKLEIDRVFVVKFYNGDGEEYIECIFKKASDAHKYCEEQTNKFKQVSRYTHAYFYYEEREVK